jgi:hypothetical protein
VAELGGADVDALEVGRRQLLAAVQEDLEKLTLKLLASGGVDPGEYEGREGRLARIVVKAALNDEAAAFALPDEDLKVVRNLRFF